MKIAYWIYTVLGGVCFGLRAAGRLGVGAQLKLDYSAKEVFDHVIPTVVRGGRAVPFTDWSTVTAK